MANTTLQLENLGWNDFFTAHYTARKDVALLPARVMAENRDSCLIKTAEHEIFARVSGNFLYRAVQRSDYPSVGDWVLFSPVDNGAKGIIHQILPRKTVLERKVSGNLVDAQVIAANIDTIFIVQGLDNNYNLRRLERYLLVGYESGARPVVILTKTDLCTPEDLARRLSHVQATAYSADIFSVSALDGTGLDELKDSIQQNETICFIGSSGAGKSTLINRLAGDDILETREVRASDSRGRHTTTRKEMIFLDNGGILIDTPGMRELGLWDVTTGLSDVFDDIEALTSQCRFKDCTHMTEPGCAVLKAVQDGAIDESRYKSFLKLTREAQYLKTKTGVKYQREKKMEEKRLHRMIKRFNKRNRKN